LIKDDNEGLDPVKDIPDGLSEAARWYANFDRREVVADLTSDGTGDFAIAGLASFEDRFSEIVSIEWPIAGSGSRRTMLDQKDYDLVRLPSGLVIRVYKAIATGDKIRASNTARHTLDTDTNTLPEAAFDAVCEYAAGYCFDQLSAEATPTTERAPQSNDLGSVFRDLSDRFASRAKSHKATAEKLLTGFVFA
jgi:hypothetical protein